MDKETFEMVDGILATKGHHDDRQAAAELLEVGVREGTLLDAAKAVAGRYALQPVVVIQWFGEVLNRRIQDAREVIAEYQKATLCRLGYCREKGSHYSGGDKELHDKINRGICPICGGPAVKPGSEVNV